MEIANNLLSALTSISKILNDLNIKYCLIGGLAVGILAKPRATEDIDFLVLINNEEKTKLLEKLEETFNVIQNHKPIILNKTRIWRIILNPKGSEGYEFIVLDFIISDNDTYNNALNDVISVKIDNININVVSPEHLIKIKEISGRPKDLLDIEELRREVL